MDLSHERIARNQLRERRSNYNQGILKLDIRVDHLSKGNQASS